MAQQLWLLRHGDAEPDNPDGDAARRLTERGEHQSRVAGGALAALGVEFAAVYSSPRVRALDTARLAAEALRVDPQAHQPLSSGFDSEDAVELLLEHGADARVLAVGHEPDFSQVVHDLTGARVDLKKGGVAAVRVDGARSELIVLMRPKELEAMAGRGDGG